jgi:membrane protease YdiL (CAAX protease family)
MSGGGFMTAFAIATNALFVFAAVYIYVALGRQIAARPAADSDGEGRRFGLPEVVLGLLLATLFAGNAVAGAAPQPKNIVMTTHDLAANALVSLGLLLFVFAFLSIRRLDVNSLAGFKSIAFRRIFATAVILLLAAYPLIFIADLISQRVLGAPSTRQGIVELFSGSQTIEQRVIIIVLAVAIAPLVEEFIFRFFFYGILKRYFGRGVGLIANAMLFAAVHAHIPSAAPLFVLGGCFTLAFEWSGSILVPMTMHALFNSLTLTALAFPNTFQQ